MRGAWPTGGGGAVGPTNKKKDTLCLKCTAYGKFRQDGGIQLGNLSVYIRKIFKYNFEKLILKFQLTNKLKVLKINKIK